MFGYPRQPLLFRCTEWWFLSTGHISVRTLHLYGDRLGKGQTEAVPGHAAILACILSLYVVDLQGTVVQNRNPISDLGGGAVSGNQSFWTGLFTEHDYSIC